MKRIRRWMAVMLSVCMLVSSTGINVQAENASLDAEKTEENASLDAEETEEKVSPDAEETEEKVSPDAEETQKVQTGVLNFVMQENTSIQIPGVQNVAVSLGEEGTVIKQAQLSYRNRVDGQEYAAEAAETAGNMARFTMEYTEESQEGIYELVSVAYQTEEGKYQVILADLGMEVSYGVNQETETEPDEILMDEEVLKEVEASVVTLDENGEAVSENSIQDVLGDAQGAATAQNAQKAAGTQASQSLVIVLDPGHDSTHAGARGNGCKEEELVLKIAQYCKAELQKYSGVQVYMTRESNTCPNGGYTVDSSTCNARRVEFAVSKKANVYVSFHLNSNYSTQPHGVGVYYPNSNYRPDIGAEGKGLATEIYKKLNALGLSTWADGILIHNSEDNTLYPDGSLADYLGVIRRSKLAGIPAVLIEHAFLSNAGDVSGFLNSDDKLRNLGVADAQGIAEYYKLSQQGSKPEIQWIQSRHSKALRVRWEKAAGAVSYQVYRSTSKNGTYKKVAELSKNTYDDKKVKSGVTYYYKVRAVLADGRKSDFSAVHSGKTLVKPEITGVISRDGSKLKISWSAVEGAGTYELLRSEAPDGIYEKIATVTASAKNTYIDRNLTAQKDYFYKVRARGGENNGYSTYSAVASGWVVKKTTITSVSSNDSTSLRIRWKKVKNAYAYRIQRSTSKNGTYKTVTTIRNGKTSYVDKNLTPGKTYYYKIEVRNRVNNKTGYSGYCNPVAGKTITSTTITYVRSNDSSSMELKWKKDSAAYAYSIKRSTSKNGKYTKIAEIRDCNITQYTDKTITSGKRYYYVVETIIDKKGVKGYSGNSKPATAVNLAKVEISGLKAGDYGITLTWKKTAGANCYQILRSTEKSSGFAEIAKVKGADVTSFTDTKVSAGARYYYRIRAIREGKYTGYGSYGKVVGRWMLTAPADLKVKPVSQSVTPENPAQMQLSWKKVTGATGYTILRSTRENGTYETVGSVSGEKTVTYTDSKVRAGVTYYYKVAAVGTVGTESGQGEETAPVSAMIPAAD